MGQASEPHAHIFWVLGRASHQSTDEQVTSRTKLLAHVYGPTLTHTEYYSFLLFICKHASTSDTRRKSAPATAAAVCPPLTTTPLALPVWRFVWLVPPFGWIHRDAVRAGNPEARAGHQAHTGRATAPSR